jgi:hypothetical protein
MGDRQLGEIAVDAANDDRPIAKTPGLIPARADTRAKLA